MRRLYSFLVAALVAIGVFTVPAFAGTALADDCGTIVARISAHNAQPHTFTVPQQQAQANAYAAEASALNAELARCKQQQPEQQPQQPRQQQQPRQEQQPRPPQNTLPPRSPQQTPPRQQQFGPPTGAERRNAPMAEKINDADYRAKYYKQQSPDGSIQRREANAVDANGQPVPRIFEDRDNPGTFVQAGKPPVPAQVTSTQPRTAPSQSDRTAVEQTLSDRRQAIDDVKRLQTQRDIEQANGGKITEATKEQLRDAYARQTRYGEELGEAAGRQSIVRDYPSSKYNVKELTDPASRGGSGEPDQVFSVTPRNGGPTRIVVNEAKSPSATLGARRGLDGNLYQQGTQGYLESLIAQYAFKNPIVAARMTEALLTGRLDYRLVRASLAADGSYTGYVVKTFGLGG